MKEETSYNNLTKRPGFSIIDNVTLSIGGTVVDILYGEWIDIWYQLSLDSNQYTKLERLIDGTLVNTDSTNCETNIDDIIKLYIPLPFFLLKILEWRYPSLR